MTKKHKSLLIFSAIALLFFIGTGFSYALEVEDYPSIPFAPKITENSELPDFVAYFFALGIYLAGALAVISLVIGGIRLVTSAENPGAVGDAKERIIGAILGLVLIFASVIILRTINPVLIKPTLTPLVVGAGIFYTNGTSEIPTPDAESDTSSIPSGYETIIYKCSEKGPGIGPVLLIQKFPQKNFEGYKKAFVERKKCGEESSVNTPSFKISFETPGVYYFIGAKCTGFMSQVNLSNTQEIGEPFKSETRSVLIINDVKNEINYGAILHKEINFRGGCTPPLESLKEERKCHELSDPPPADITFPPASANIFVINKDDPKTSGNGLVFYSKAFGYNVGTNAGYFKLQIPPEKIIKFWQNTPDKIDFSYAGINVPEQEKKLCTYFTENIKSFCGGSIKIQGNYLAILYAKKQDKFPYCQVFDEDVPNLKEEEVIAVEGRELETIYVIPVK